MRRSYVRAQHILGVWSATLPLPDYGRVARHLTAIGGTRPQTGIRHQFHVIRQPLQACGLPGHKGVTITRNILYEEDSQTQCRAEPAENPNDLQQLTHAARQITLARLAVCMAHLRAELASSKVEARYYQLETLVAKSWLIKALQLNKVILREDPR